MSNIYRQLLVTVLILKIFISTAHGFNPPAFVSKFGRGSYDTNGELNFPSGIAVDSNGNVYVCEQFNNRISKFDGEGNFLTKWSSSGCMGVTTDNSNNVYVASETGHKVRKYDSNGVLLLEWGSYGNGNGQFNTPRDITVNNNLNRVYVLDSENYRVQVFDLNGAYQFKWGTFGGGSSQFNSTLFGIAADQNSGNVYVAVSGSNKIKKFDADGNFLLQWGSTGKSEGLYYRWPRGIDVDSSGNIYVASTDGERIQKLDSNGNVVLYIQGVPGIGLPGSPPGCTPHLTHTDCTTLNNEKDGPFHPRAVAVDPRNGNIFVAAAYAQRIDKFDSSGNFLTKWGWLEKNNGVFNIPRGIAIDSANGNLYLADTGNFLIQQFDLSGSFIRSWGYSGRVYNIFDQATETQRAYGFDFPSAITTDADGNIYVLHPDTYYPGDAEIKRVARYDRNGNLLSNWNYAGFYENMQGIVHNPYNNRLYVVNTLYNKIQCLDVNGNFLFEFGGTGTTEGKFNLPSRIAVNKYNGNIYVVDVGNNRIQKFSSSGIFLTAWGQYGAGDGQLKIGSYSGIYVDVNGYIYVADTGNSRIQVFDSNGQFIMKWGSWSGVDGSFIYPQGVVVDSNGYIYVVDSGKENVQKFSPVIGLFNTPPAADPKGPYTGIEGQAISLDGSGSSDSNGSIVLYEWDIDNDGTYDYSSSSPAQSHTYTLPGVYTIKLRVTDNLGSTGEATTTAGISAINPTASFTVTPAIGTEPLTVNFTNASSGYNLPLSYEWDFENDGIVDSTDRDPAFVYMIPGIYTVKLVVRDSTGYTDTLIRTNYVTVAPSNTFYTLTVYINGSGWVTSVPSGINCPGICSEQIYPSEIELSATVSSGHVFDKWIGCDHSAGNRCTMTMNADKGVIANLTAQYQLTTSVDPAVSGNISPDCSGGCLYNSGDWVVLTATTNSGYIFSGWTGCDSASQNTCTMTMDADKNTAAEFEQCLSPVRIVRQVPVYYPTLQEAYDAAGDGETVQSQAVGITESLIADINKSVTFDGGYDCSYTTNAGNTTLNGALTINNGTITIRNFVLQ
jgi:DNA-binding beta-propeller fold protein YncE